MNERIISKRRERPAGYSRRGFSLIEVIGVAAILALLALTLTQTVIKRTDYAAVTTEQANLAALTNALTLQALRNDNIPSQANWATAMANWLSWSADAITNNARHNARAYLMDTSGWLAAGGYTQTASGTNTAPTNARVMFVSSIGQALPSGLLSSTPLSAADFNNLWNSTAGTVPASGAWSGWTGNAGDVAVQRLNLSSLFYQLILVNRDPVYNATFSINSSGTSSVANGTPWNAYYLAGSVVGLSSNSVLQTKSMLGHNTGCVSENGGWGGQIASGTNGTVDTNVVGSVFSSAAKAFYAAATNPNASKGSGIGGDQSSVLAVFDNLMTIYTLWANDSLSSFPTYGNSSAKNHLPVWLLLQQVQGYLVYASSDPNQGLLAP